MLCTTTELSHRGVANGQIAFRCAEAATDVGVTCEARPGPTRGVARIAEVVRAAGALPATRCHRNAAWSDPGALAGRAGTGRTTTSIHTASSASAPTVRATAAATRQAGPGPPCDAARIAEVIRAAGALPAARHYGKTTRSDSQALACRACPVEPPLPPAPPAPTRPAVAHARQACPSPTSSAARIRREV